MAAHSGIASGDVWESFESNSTAASSSAPQYPSFDAWLIHFSSGFLAGLTQLARDAGRSAIELAPQQIQRAGKHSWIQEKNSEREFQRKFFLLIPLSKGKETEKACLHRLLPILRWRQRPYPSYQQLYRD